MRHKPLIIAILILTFLFTGCSEANHTTTAVSGSALLSDTSSDATSGQAVSGDAVSGDAAVPENYSITPEMDDALHWLSLNQEKWCNEANLPDESTINCYAVTDMDHDGLIEVAQFIDMNFVSYSEVVPNGNSYELNVITDYDPEDYSMGIMCDADEAGNTTESFTRDDHPDVILPDDFRPRSEAAWAMIQCANADNLAELNSTETDDPHITITKNDNIYFGTGIDIRITAKADPDAMYRILRENLEAFLYCDRVSKEIRDELIRIYKSDEYAKAAMNRSRITVTDENSDGKLEMKTLSEDDYNKKSRRKEDKISVEAKEGDSSRVGEAYMRYCIWKIYLLDTDEAKKGFLGLFFLGMNHINHYFPGLLG